MGGGTACSSWIKCCSNRGDCCFSVLWWHRQCGDDKGTRMILYVYIWLWMLDFTSRKIIVFGLSLSLCVSGFRFIACDCAGWGEWIIVIQSRLRLQQNVGQVKWIERWYSYFILFYLYLGMAYKCAFSVVASLWCDGKASNETRAARDLKGLLDGWLVVDYYST